MGAIEISDAESIHNNLLYEDAIHYSPEYVGEPPISIFTGNAILPAGDTVSLYIKLENSTYAAQISLSSDREEEICRAFRNLEISIPTIRTIEYNPQTKATEIGKSKFIMQKMNITTANLRYSESNIWDYGIQLIKKENQSTAITVYLGSSGLIPKVIDDERDFLKTMGNLERIANTIFAPLIRDEKGSPDMIYYLIPTLIQIEN